jgi:uncharacterized protein (TIGR01777 family)
MKKMIIAGGSGLIGSALIEYFLPKGYEIVLISRAASSKSSPRTIAWDDSQTLAEEVSGADCIVNLAGASIAGSKWTEEYKETIINSRVETTTKIVEAIKSAEVNPKLLINASATGYYGDRRDEELDEKSMAGSGFLSKVCQQWENATNDAKPLTRVVRARIGVVLSKHGGALDKMLLPIKMYMGGKLGSGNQWMSWIHITDLVRLVEHIINDENIKGAVNFVAPRPSRNKEFTKSIGLVLNRPVWAPVPDFALNFLLGESKEMVLASQRVVPEKALKSGFEYKFANLITALKDLLA